MKKLFITKLSLKRETCSFLLFARLPNKNIYALQEYLCKNVQNRLNKNDAVFSYIAGL